MRDFNAMMKGFGEVTVKGDFTKLKGYSKLKIYCHKLNRTWYIREFYSGRELGSATTQANAKKDARSYLKDYTLDQILDQIESLDRVNED